MIMKLDTEDGQEFEVGCGYESGAISVFASEWDPFAEDVKRWVILSADEARAVIALLEHAITVAEKECPLGY